MLTCRETASPALGVSTVRGMLTGCPQGTAWRAGTAAPLQRDLMTQLMVENASQASTVPRDQCVS